MRPVHSLQTPGNLQAFKKPPARAVNLQDYQVYTLLLGGIQLSVQIAFQTGIDFAAKTDHDSVLVRDGLVGKTIGSSQQERADRNEERSRRLCNALSFQ